jgi:hypothetical protein
MPVQCCWRPLVKMSTARLTVTPVSKLSSYQLGKGTSRAFPFCVLYVQPRLVRFPKQTLNPKEKPRSPPSACGTPLLFLCVTAGPFAQLGGSISLPHGPLQPIQAHRLLFRRAGARNYGPASSTSVCRNPPLFAVHCLRLLPESQATVRCACEGDLLS